MTDGFEIKVVKKPDFKAKTQRARTRLAQTLNDIGHLVTAEVAASSPYRTGKMRRSHRARIRGVDRVDVIGWTDYLEFVLRGTRYITPRNWPKWGVDRSISTIRSIIRAQSNFATL